jgi:hypothetical protein
VDAASCKQTHVDSCAGLSPWQWGEKMRFGYDRGSFLCAETRAATDPEPVLRMGSLLIALQARPDPELHGCMTARAASTKLRHLLPPCANSIESRTDSGPRIRPSMDLYAYPCLYIQGVCLHTLLSVSVHTRGVHTHAYPCRYIRGPPSTARADPAAPSLPVQLRAH